MADQDDSKVTDVVSAVTVKALQEFSSGDMDPTGKSPSGGSRPTSASRSKPASPAGSRPGSAKGSKPASAAGSRPTSAAGSKPGTPAGSRPGSAAKKITPDGSKAGSRPGSKAGSRPGSKAGSKAGSRPASRADASPDDVGLEVTGSRPTSAAGQPSSRPASARSDRPPSGKASSIRVTSGIAGSDRPTSGRPTSGRPTSDRPRSSRPGSERRAPAEPEEEDRDEFEEEPTQELADGHWGSSQAGSGQNSGRGQRAPPQTSEMYTGPTQYTDPMAEFSGDESGEEFEEGEEVDEMESGSDAENEMVVLDPDHPLMKRFQKALGDHLEKQHEKVTLELRELEEGHRKKRKDREDTGVELYGVQQELARHQMMVEKRHDELASLQQDRNMVETQLREVRDMYRGEQSATNIEKKKGAELQGEVENLALRIFYMENAKEDVRSDINVMKRAAEKADTEVAKSEIQKQKQDLYVDRLVERADKLKEEIAMYEAQIQAQTEELVVAKDALTEAGMEIEAITMEKKQLFQQWNSSLIGMRRRDEAHSAMMEALNQQRQRIMSLETEIEGFKRSINKEQEMNEKLTMILSKTDADITTTKKMFAQCQAKHDALKNEYATYTRMLHETEQALIRATTDKTLRQNELNALRKQIEKEYLEKVKLEEEILEKLRSQMTLDKASQYSERITSKITNRTKELETSVALVENDISKAALDTSNARMRIERLKKVMAELDEEIAAKNDIISKSEGEIKKRNALIERKQLAIDSYNKKLEHMISKAGGVELGPLEIQINSLRKSIEAEQDGIAELQQLWMRGQTELVRLSREKDGQSCDVEYLKKQITVLSQRKIRIEGEINREERDSNEIDRSIEHMQNDMVRLNQLIHKERGTEEVLQKTNVLVENDFIGGLKEAEMESILMQSNLDGLKEEKERLLNSLVEAERQIMLWEKKTQLARETRAAVDSEIGQGEIKAMKSEIHRMSVRYTQLMKQQEKMIQEMEKAVSRRDTIVTRGEAQTKIQKSTKVLTKGSFQRQMAETKKKIKTTIQDANESDHEIRNLREHQQTISNGLEDKQIIVQQLQGSADSLDGDVEKLLEQKQKNLTELVGKQQKMKYYQQVKDGRYTRLCKTDSALGIEYNKQTDRMQTLSAIVDRLNQEFPHIQPALHKLNLALATRGVPAQ